MSGCVKKEDKQTLYPFLRIVEKLLFLVLYSLQIHRDTIRMNCFALGQYHPEKEHHEWSGLIE